MHVLLILTLWNYQNLVRTRGNKYKLVQHHCHYDLRKFNFTNSVVPIWNSLSNHVVAAVILSFGQILVTSGSDFSL